MKRALKFLTLFLCLVVLMSAAVFALTQWRLAQPLASAGNDDVFEVAVGDTARSIVSRVNSRFNRDFSELDYRLSQFLVGVDRLPAGVYRLSSNDSWLSLWSRIKNNEEALFSITLIEGQTITQWMTQLNRAEYMKHTIDGVDELSVIMGIEQASAEGWFYPETYHYRAHETDRSILRRAHDKMKTIVNEAWQQRNPRCEVDSPYELLILASIIEKETGLSGERDLVSSVFHNRLRVGMRLQSDPTTIYGIDDFDGNLTRAHLREKTPYNTYRIDGLPRTPIAIPSEAAVRAAAQPVPSDYFYFVANKQGEHVFSETLEQHQRAVRRYQLNQDTE